MGYATPIRNFYTSSGDKLDLKFAKIWHSIIPINSITKSWERLRCFTDTHQNNQTCHCSREDSSSYWARRRYMVETRSGFNSYRREVFLLLAGPMYHIECPQMTMNPADWRISQDRSSLEYFLRSLSNFIHPPRRSYSTRLSRVCSRDLSHCSPRVQIWGIRWRQVRHVVTRPKSLFVACISTRETHSTVDSPNLFTQIIVCNIFLGIHPSIW